MLTQERLKELLSYDPMTGDFTRIKGIQGGRCGVVAGTIHPAGYNQISIDSKTCRAHRIAFLYMTGSMPKNHVDHINGARHDNRWANLREASPYDNSKNQRKAKNNTSGVTGISRRKEGGLWRVDISIDKKQVFMGDFNDFFEACCVRKSAELTYGYHENHGNILSF